MPKTQNPRCIDPDHNWTPVENGDPEPGGRYLIAFMSITFQGNEILLPEPVVTLGARILSAGDGKYYWFAYSGCDLGRPVVTHYMPMPDKPY